jgi:hypothetical protein
LVVASHVLLVGFAAFFLQARITAIETYLSTLAVFLPVFGTYLSIVVKSVGMSRGPRGKLVSSTFISLMLILFVAYSLGIVFVLYSYATGFIGTEEALPGAIGLVEAAFGGFFTTLFVTLFGGEEPPQKD